MVYTIIYSHVDSHNDNANTTSLLLSYTERHGLHHNLTDLPIKFIAYHDCFPSTNIDIGLKSFLVTVISYFLLLIF